MTLVATSTQAHEFWIDPVDYAIAPGGRIEADIRVGERFEGNVYSYLPRNFRLADAIAAGARKPLDGRLGDRPALVVPDAPEGLVTLLYASTDSRLTWDSYDLFAAFVREKAADWVLAAHDARGHPRDGVTETYSRYAKSLVAVGDGAGADADRGLTTEIVALANPYTDDVTGGLPVRVLYQQRPRPGAQVEIFALGDDGIVDVTTVTTDDDGDALISVAPGTEYLLDAVVFRAPDPAESGAAETMWETLWASLTFRTPG